MPLEHDDRVFFDKHGGVHPVTQMKLEDGHGALPIARQAELHCWHIEQTAGKSVADMLRRQLGLIKDPVPPPPPKPVLKPTVMTPKAAARADDL